MSNLALRTRALEAGMPVRGRWVTSSRNIGRIQSQKLSVMTFPLEWIHSHLTQITLTGSFYIKDF